MTLFHMQTKIILKHPETATVLQWSQLELPITVLQINIIRSGHIVLIFLIPYFGNLLIIYANFEFHTINQRNK